MLSGSLELWAHARALLRSMARLKWELVSESKFKTEDGIVLDLEELSTAYVVKVALQSVGKWVAEHTAYSIGRPDLRHGIWWQPIHSVLRSAPPRGACYVNRVMCGSEHTQADLYRVHRADTKE